MWFEKLDFRKDPYTPTNPFEIPLDFIKWNRDDLRDSWKLERFIEDATHGYRVGLRVYGPAGSGKTWLLRYLQKSLLGELGDKVAVIYGKIMRVDPTFSALYDALVQGWNQHREKILLATEKKVGTERASWKDYIEDNDLAACLHEIRYPRQKEKTWICEHWLRGTKIGAGDLNDVGITSSLDRDYRKYLTLRKLLELALWAFDSCLLIIDELENAQPARFAGALGDSLRDLLDSFSEGFALACGYTADAADELLDWGFGEFLFTRLEWDVKLDPITPDSAPGIFRVHHSAYRIEGYTGDQLAPFTEQGLQRLINCMDQARWWPRPILINCGMLGRAASEAGVDIIDKDFVDKQTSESPERFQYLTSKPRLM
jgi:hypothetical protein